MCNAHFQHLFDNSAALSPSSYSTADVARHQQQSSRSQLAIPPHDSASGTHDNSVPSLSPVSGAGWSYPMDTQSDAQMYSPASSTSYSGFHSPIEANGRAYVLAGALQNQQQQQQSGAAYPESSQRTTEQLTRGGSGHATFFAETHQQQQVAAAAVSLPQRWGYAGHAHAHAHDFAQEALSMSRASIIDSTQAQAPTASDDGGNGHECAIPPAFGAAGGARLAMPDGSGASSAARAHVNANAAGDQRGSGRHQQQGQEQHSVAFSSRPSTYPHLQQQNHHHRAMSSHSHQHQHQQSQWLSQAHAQLQTQQMGGAPYLQVPTPRAVNAPHSNALRNFFPYAAGNAAGAEFDCEIESDEFGEHEDYDEALDDDDSGVTRAGQLPHPHPHQHPHHLHLGGIPPPASPTPELQFPQNVSGTPSELMRANFMLYGADPANWPMETLGGLTPGGPMGSFIDTNAGSGPGSGPAESSSPRSGGPGSGKGGAKIASTISPSEFFRQSEKKEKGKRTQGSGAGGAGEETEGTTVKVLIASATPGEPPKKVKMHQCRICSKLFPRPSGLATHMNSHSGARPFKCPLELCPKTFAVRSNARRHLRTHGITVPPNSLNKNGSGRNQEEPFHVGFETPVVVEVQDPSGNGNGGCGGSGNGAGGNGGNGGRPPKLRWVPPSLATRTIAPRLRSLSPASDMADLDTQDVSLVGGGAGIAGNPGGDVSMGRLDYDVEDETMMMFAHRRAPGLRIAPAPLPPAVPSAEEGAADLQTRFDERNSYAEAGTYPYHPDQWRCLPGPGLVLPLRS